LCGARGRVARPVAAGVIGAVGEGRAIELRAGEDVVLVRRVADAFHGVALLGERGDLRQVVAAPRRFERVAVQVGHVLRDARVLRVVPRAGADAVGGVDGRLSAAGAGAQVRVPGAVVARAGCGRELLAVTIRPGEPAKIGPVPGANAGDEEGHR